MTNKLISLVILIFFIITGHSYSDNQFIFPKKKPSIFKEINKNIDLEITNNLPQKKPVIQVENEKVKIEKKVEKKQLDNKKIKKQPEATNNSLVFLYPQKKPITYKLSSKEVA